MLEKFSARCNKKFYFALAIYTLQLLLLGSCNPSGSAKGSSKDSAIYNYEIIPQQRDTVSTQPVASYMENVEGFSPQEGFSINVFETKETFHFLAEIHDKGQLVKDTFKIPNFGIWPKIEIYKGEEKYSCIVGFLDKDNTFREYKEIYVKDQKLTIHILKHYAVYTYQDTLKNDKKK